MIRKTLIPVFVILFAVCSSVDLFAFDNDRKGFVLGLGVGPSLTSYTQTIEDGYFGKTFTSDRENALGVGTDFKFGYGLNRNMIVYYENRMSWFSMESVLGDVTIANGVQLLGISYYMAPEAPSLYLTGTFGISYWMAPFEEDLDTWIGFGLAAGVGYEFSRGWMIEADIMYGKPGGETEGFDELWMSIGDVDIYSSAMSVMVTINYLAY